MKHGYLIRAFLVYIKFVIAAKMRCLSYAILANDSY
jgi:hypothetical protein